MTQEDTSNKGTYAGVRFDEATIASLQAYIEENNILLPVTNFHTTLLYSRNYLPNYRPQNPKFPMRGKARGVEKFDGGSVLVVTFACPALEGRHNALMREHDDATWDFENYVPHITLTYSAMDIVLEELTKPRFKISIVQEYGEDLDLEYSE